jgi:hypothetical protein
MIDKFIINKIKEYTIDWIMWKICIRKNLLW